MTSFLLLANLLFGLREPSSVAADALPRPGAGPACCDAAMKAGWIVPHPFTADAPAAVEMTPEAVRQRRNRFVSLVKMGTFDRFDDARQEAIFKRNDPARPVREPGPLEDEAIASATREALAAEYGKLGLKPRLTCAAGNSSSTACRMIRSWRLRRSTLSLPWTACRSSPPLCR